MTSVRLTLKAYEACACPALRPKKEQESVTEASVISWMGECTHLRQDFAVTSPHVQQDSSQDVVADFAPKGKGRSPARGGIASDWLIS